MPRTPNVTVRDVARRAGVSPSTVSNALTGERPVSEAARRRVEQAAKALGYSPNMLARGLVRRRSHTLGVVTSGLQLFGPSSTLAGIERQANEYKYSLLLNLIPRPGDGDVMASLSAVVARQVDGLIWAVPEISANRAWITPQLLSRLPPVVFLSMRRRPRVHVVAIDNRSGARLAVHHLVARGRRRVAHVAGPTEWWEARERRQGWVETLRRAGLPASETLVAAGDWSPASGEHALRDLLARRPDIDALFVANDQMALGVLRAAQQLGRRVPDDLAVVGFDSIPESAYFSPSLTTVVNPMGELGRFAVRTLHALIEGANGTPAGDAAHAAALTPTLVVRESA